MKKKYIDIIVSSVIGLIILGVTGGVTLSSYLKYQEYYKENYPEIDPADNAILLSLSAELKEGVAYYKNNKAKPMMNDFIVTGTYQPKDQEEGQGIFTQILNPLKRPYSVEVGDMFAINGGTITITYSGISTTLDITLKDVLLADLNISSLPYTIKYQVNETFDTTGMIVEALYNDGSSKELNDYEYNVSNVSPLSLSDKKIIISYTEQDITKTKDVSISVVNELNNGEIKSIAPTKEYFFVDDGTNLNSASFEILATYSSGNKKILSSSSFTINTTNEIARLGKKYVLDVSLTSKNKIKTQVNLYVRDHFEGENTTIVGGEIKTETEYAYINNIMTQVGPVTFAGNFGKSVTDGKKAYISFNVTSYTEHNSSISMRCSNSNLFKIDNEYWMRPLRINTIADLIVNDEKVDVSDDVVLAGCGPYASYAPLYNIYSLFTFENVPLKIGTNTITLQFKMSSINEKNYWDESPSTMNIDYIDVVSEGNNKKNTSKITEIYFQEGFTLNYGDNFDTASIPVFAKHKDESISILDENELIIKKPSGYVGVGTYTIRATLVSDNSKTCEVTFTIPDIVLEAENATISGNNKVKAETSTTYSFENQTEDGSATVISGMDNSSLNYGGETSLTFSFIGTSGNHGLVIRCDNSYFFAAGNNNTAPYYTKEIDLNQCVDIYLNGNKITFSAPIPSLSQSLNIQNDNIPWWTFFSLDIGNINLVSGTNTIKIVGLSSAPKNRWNEPSVPKFDYIKLTKPF